MKRDEIATLVVVFVLVLVFGICIGGCIEQNIFAKRRFREAAPALAGRDSLRERMRFATVNYDIAYERNDRDTSAYSGAFDAYLQRARDLRAAEDAIDSARIDSAAWARAGAVFGVKP